jgi:hypothetical protein
MNPQAQQHLCRARELLEVAQHVLAYPADSISRSYYAVFHAATGALLGIDIDRSSHHGVWAAFGEFLVAPGLIDAQHHRSGLRLFRARSRSDYLAIPEDTPEDAQQALSAARDFVAACQVFLETRGT